MRHLSLWRRFILKNLFVDLARLILLYCADCCYTRISSRSQQLMPGHFSLVLNFYLVTDSVESGKQESFKSQQEFCKFMISWQSNYTREYWGTKSITLLFSFQNILLKHCKENFTWMSITIIYWFIKTSFETWFQATNIFFWKPLFMF